jgi:spermidine dehydrogenase
MVEGAGVERQEFIDGSAYPPVRTGLRGSHPGSFETAHEIRDGRTFDVAGLPVGETVDLVVVGAGISGLASAWFYRQRRPDASILLLDNHDDFGGHAKRNEFRIDGRMLLGYGGSEALQSPNTLYSDVAKGLLGALGVDIRRFETAFDRELYPSLGLSRGVFFTREAFGEDRLVTGDPMRMVADDIPADRMNERSVAEFIADYPVSEDARVALVELFSSARDPLGDLALDDKVAVLATTSYRDYVMKYWGLDGEAANTFQGRSCDFFARGVDSISALDAMQTGYPGFAGLAIPASPEAAAEMDEPYIYHFPDGNSSIARLIVRALIPAVGPGATMEDIITSHFDYAVLDEPASPTRVRLRSTVVKVGNVDGGVDVGYVRDGELHRLRAGDCVLAGYHMMIPSIVPEIAVPQRRALWKNVKAPIVYVKVLVRDWHPWVRLGVHEITNPMGFFSRLKLDYPVSLGDYRCPRSPDEPMVLHLVHVPTVPFEGLSVRQQSRAAREALFEMTFADFEQRVRGELTRMLGPGGFDADRDIAAITVNRWGHGYSYAGDPLFDEPATGRMPYEVARERVGRIAIANADAAWMPFAHVAIDQAYRAVEELLSL